MIPKYAFCLAPFLRGGIFWHGASECWGLFPARFLGSFVKRTPAPKTNPTAQFLGISPFGMWPDTLSLCFLTGMLEISKTRNDLEFFFFFLFKGGDAFCVVSLPRTMRLDVCERCEAKRLCKIWRRNGSAFSSHHGTFKESTPKSTRQNKAPLSSIVRWAFDLKKFDFFYSHNGPRREKRDNKKSGRMSNAGPGRAGNRFRKTWNPHDCLMCALYTAKVFRKEA